MKIRSTAAAFLAGLTLTVPLAGSALANEASTVAPPPGAETSVKADVSVVPNASYKDCPPGWACLWENIGFKGKMVKFHDSGFVDLGDYRFGDRVSSLRNRTDRRLHLFNVRTDGPHDRIYFLPGRGHSDLRMIAARPGRDLPHKRANWNDILDWIAIR